jgi:predicted dehydrogenase
MAARKYKRIVPVGSQTNSAAYYRDALDYVRSGKLGDILLVRSQVMERSSKTVQPKPDPQAPVPEGLDWDMWCGPVGESFYWMRRARHLSTITKPIRF